MRLPRLRFTTWLLAALALAVVWACPHLLYHRYMEIARREQCGNNFKRIGLALDMYASVHGSFPYGAVPSADLPVGRRLSWLVTLLDFLYGNAPNIRDKTLAWDEPTAAALVRIDKETGKDVPAGSDILAYHCPTAGAPNARAGRELTEYVGMAGLGADAPSLPLGHPRAGVFGYERATPTGRITDGLGSTAAVVEAREGRGPWRAGGPSTVRGLDPARRPYIGRGRQFGGAHRGGAMVAFADGSVRFLSETIDPKVFEALSTVAGGETVPSGWDR